MIDGKFLNIRWNSGEMNIDLTDFAFFPCPVPKLKKIMNKVVRLSDDEMEIRGELKQHFHDRIHGCMEEFKGREQKVSRLSTRITQKEQELENLKQEIQGLKEELKETERVRKQYGKAVDQFGALYSYMENPDG